MYIYICTYVYIYIYPIGSMYAIYGNIDHQYTPNVSIYTIHGSYGYDSMRIPGAENGATVPYKAIFWWYFLG